MKRGIRQLLIKGMLVIGIVCGISAVKPMDTQAALKSVAILTVEDQMFVYDGEVVKTSHSNGKGGTAVYDPATNTLTLTNYTFTKIGRNRTFIYAYCMSNDQTFRIVLKGTNTMIRAEELRMNGEVENECINFDTCDAIIEGNGKLIANTYIGGGGTYVVKDCDLEINGYYYGFYCDDLTLRNANVTLSSEYYRTLGGALYTGVGEFDGNLTLENSVLRVKADGTHWTGALLQNADDGRFSIDQKLVIPADATITDDAGNPLNVCRYDPWGNKYYVFSKDAAKGSLLTSNALISKTVNIVCSGKGKQVTAIDTAINAINAIGTVTLNSEAAIKRAEEAYKALDNLGGDAAYAKAKVYNQKKLTEARTIYNALVIKHREEIKAEEAKKQEETKSQSGQTTGDKVIKVKGKKYVLKKPKISSAKSKKKKTVTLKWTTDKNCTGYQISYSTSKSFKKTKTKTVYVKNKKTKTKTITNLKSKRTYYIRIREYKTIKGKKYFGNWSKVKKVKVK